MFYTHPILKPLFMAVARMPLIGPHTGFEAALLRAGAKPIGMFGPHDPALDELETDIAEGRLIKTTIPRTHPHTKNVYGWNDIDINEVAYAYHQFLSVCYADKKPQDADNDAIMKLMRDFNFAAYGHTARYETMNTFDHIKIAALNLVPDAFKRQLDVDYKKIRLINDKNMNEFLQGSRRAYAIDDNFTHHYADRSLLRQLNDMTQIGDIQCKPVQVDVDTTLIFVGQPGQEKNMDDLAFIQTCTEEEFDNNTRGLDEKSEGKLLGYSDNDVDYWLNRESYDPSYISLLNKTWVLRGHIRRGLMTEMGPNWPK